jgi:hypothetical protein
MKSESLGRQGVAPWLSRNAASAHSRPAPNHLSAATIFPRTAGYLASGHREGIMSQKLKTDLALFAAAFIASAFVLGADTGFAHMLGAVLGAN